MGRIPVALYVPNILGYVRIALAFVGLAFSTSQPVKAVTIWIASGLLDMIDGPLARKLNQTSSFGVFLDIAADNILRSCVWIASAAASPSPIRLVVAAFVICIEWTTMVSTQVHAASSHGTHWKKARENDNWLMRQFFSNNFRNPIGALGVYGLFAANLFAYGSQYAIFVDNIPQFWLWMYLAYAGRAITICVEVPMCCSYFSYVLEQDAKSK